MPSLLARVRVDASGLFLIVANCVPLVGVWYYHWSVVALVMGYWAESAVMLGYVELKTFCSYGYRAIDAWKRKNYKEVAMNVPGCFIPMAIEAGVGAFALYFYLFVISTFLFSGLDGSALHPDASPLRALAALPIATVIAFVVSHGVSFFTKYVRKQQYRLDSSDLISSFTQRLGVLHLLMFIGVVLYTTFVLPQVYLCFLVVVKTVADLAAHNREHGRLEQKLVLQSH